MYKSDHQRIESAIIPYIIRECIDMHKDPRYKDARELLTESIDDCINYNKKVRKDLKKAAKSTLSKLEGWQTKKVFMVMSTLAFSLHEAGELVLGKGAKKIIEDINNQVSVASDDERIGEDVKKIDASAAKQVPKVLKLIQEEGYF